MQHRVWQLGAVQRHETTPNLTAFAAFEFQQGVQAYSPPYPSAGFENSLFYRKVIKDHVKLLFQHSMYNVFIASLFSS